MARASGCGPECWGFKSPPSTHLFIIIGMEERKHFNEKIEISTLWNVRRKGKSCKLTKDQGYVYIKIDWKKVAVHRISGVCYFGLNINDPKTMMCHKNDIRDDNRVDNLFIGASKDNVRDMWSKGRAKLPPKHFWNRNHAKLNWIDVLTIRFYKLTGVRSKLLAQTFDVNRKTIHDVCSGVSRKI